MYVDILFSGSSLITYYLLPTYYLITACLLILFGNYSALKGRFIKAQGSALGT